MTAHTDNTIDYIELPAESAAALEESSRFFAQAFGWTWKAWGDTYADTDSAGLGCGVNADGDHRPAKPLVVLYSTDLEGVRERVLAAGGRITRDIFSFPGGRRFHFVEPAGNELGVWSDR